MNILLISPSYSSGRNAEFFPVGMASVGAYLKSHGHAVGGLNLNNTPSPRHSEVLHDAIRRARPDLIGIGGLVVAHARIARLIAEVRRLAPGVPVVVGGGIMTCDPDLMMHSLRPDYGVIGEGEMPMAGLAAALAEGTTDLAGVGGLACWRDGTLTQTGPGQWVTDLDALPQPDLELFGIREYLSIGQKKAYDYHLYRFDNTMALPVSGSRSCPFRCTFCFHPCQGAYRQFSVPYLMNHIERCISTYGVRSFSILDELFSASEERMMEFCEAIRKVGRDIRWECQLRVTNLNPAILRSIKAAGCSFLSLGFESGSDRILRSMEKKITTTEIAAAVKSCREAGVGFQANLLFGDPEESRETVRESLAFQEQHALHFVDWSAVIPYPDSALYRYCLDSGRVTDRLQFVKNLGNISTYLWRDMVNMTAMPDGEFRETYAALRELNDRNHGKRPVRILSAEATGAFSSRLDIECPACGHTVRGWEIAYPAECSHGGAPNPDALVGLRGVNILCPECCRKMHLAAVAIPHVAARYARFQKEIDALVAAARPVVVVSAMDRLFTAFSQGISLEGLRVQAVLDSRPSRLGTTFMGREVAPLTEEKCRAFGDAPFLVLPWVESRMAMQLLERAGVGRKKIVCWNLLFCESSTAQE